MAGQNLTTSIIIPANNEAIWISACLEAVLASERLEQAEILVVANGCTDNTVDIAERYIKLAEAKKWSMRVFDLQIGDKLHALNVGDRHATGDVRIYLDADVQVSNRVLHQIERALDREEAGWASGKLRMAAASRVSRAYGRFWSRVPFMAKSVPGSGLFAVNKAGRERWGDFPNIISDDMYVRLLFKPRERYGVPGTYVWPIAEGWRNLIKVRRRQNKGVEQIAERYGHLLKNEDKGAFDRKQIASVALAYPIGFFVYATVSLIVRFTKDQSGEAWSRGR
ncbi:MAG: glycosyltransferase [Pseudomonadota bacterium]|nr:glycosyltransferase [Pseudomonadota bacterium]